MKTVKSSAVDGIEKVKLTSWRDFYSYVNQTLPNPQDYIFRGQRLAAWRLESSIDRTMRKLGPRINRARITARHLEQFQLAARTRRGANPKHLDELEYWALGQHYGLWTPLLDWTESPFVALYFAFEEENEARHETRAVFALSRPLVNARCESIRKAQPFGSPARPDIVEFITPETDENARLVSQGGLFTRGTVGVAIEEWVSIQFGGNSQDIALAKILVPEKKGDRFEILRTLNRMNINHRSLFPDVEGSAKFCNMRLSVTKY
jgi:hypothetical protein